MKLLFCYILYQYNTTIRESHWYIGLYTILLVINIWFILSTGNDPGYVKSGSGNDNDNQGDFVSIDKES